MVAKVRGGRVAGPPRAMRRVVVLIAAQRMCGQPPANWLQPLRDRCADIRSIMTATAGEPIDFVADTYRFTTDDVEQAISYEASRRRVA